MFPFIIPYFLSIFISYIYFVINMKNISAKRWHRKYFNIATVSAFSIAIRSISILISFYQNIQKFQVIRLFSAFLAN